MVKQGQEPKVIEVQKPIVKKARAMSAKNQPASKNAADSRKSLLARDDNRKACPHCGRMFSDDAAARHFPICERNAQKSKQMVVRDTKKGQPPLPKKSSTLLKKK